MRPGGQALLRHRHDVEVREQDDRRAAAVAGSGVTLLPTFIVGADLISGKLRQVLPEFCPPQISINAVFPSRRWLSPKVRSFVDFLVEYFGDQPEWDAFGDNEHISQLQK